METLEVVFPITALACLKRPTLASQSPRQYHPAALRITLHVSLPCIGVESLEDSRGGPGCLQPLGAAGRGGFLRVRDILDGVPRFGELAHTLLSVPVAALGHEAR